MKFTEKAITRTARFGCDTETMWKRWSSYDGLRTFFGAENKIELWPGGAFEIYFMMTLPYGSRGSEGCKVLSFVPGRSITFSWNAPPHLQYVRNHPYKTPVTVLIDKESEGCKVTITHNGWPDSASDGPEGKQWDDVYAYFDKAWDQVLGSLQASFS